jgi:hypothetical protein
LRRRLRLERSACYAAIWEQARSPEQVLGYGLPAPVYQTEFNMLVSQGYRLKWVEGFGMGPQTYYTAIWEPATGPAWKERHGLTAAEYQIQSVQNMADGYRLTHLSAFDVGGVDYYAAIWEQGGGPAQVARIRKTSAEFQEEVVDRSVQGYRLKRISGYALANSASYAGLWEAEPSALTGTYCADLQCFDLLRFADGMEASLAGGVVKYGFEVRRGRSVIQRAMGPKRTAMDPPASNFTVFDRFNPPSVSKVVTAVATLQLLSKREVPLDPAVYPTFRRTGASRPTTGRSRFAR